MLESRRFSWWTVLLCVCLLAGSILPVAAAVPTVYDFRLTQGTASLPAVSAYADIIGAGEVPAKGLQPEDFKAVIGTTPVKVSRLVPFEDSGEGIGYVLLVDVSKSLSSSQFSLMKETLAAFVDAMSERDQATLVTFGSEVRVVQEFTPNRSKIKDALAKMGPADEDTAFYAGIEKAISVARSAGTDVPRRRVVITLTDGVNDLTGGASKGSISASLSTDPVPLYLIGYVQGKPSVEEESAIGVMKDFASQSGGRFYDGRSGAWRGIYFAITRAIRSSFVIEIDAAGFRSEGAVYPLELSLASGGRTWKTKLQLTVPAGGTAAALPEASATASKQAQGTAAPTGPMQGNTWIYVGAAMVAAGLAAGWFLFRRRSAGQSQARESGGPSAVAATGTAEVDPQNTILPAGAPVAAGNGSPGVLIRLTRTQAGPTPEQWELEIVDRVILGQDPAVSHLVFEDDNGISPAHCEIAFDSGSLYVRDLGSVQGTFLNGTKILSRHKIEELDVLRIGQTEMRITFPA